MFNNNLLELAKQMPGVSVTISLEDLLSANKQLIEDAKRAEIEKEAERQDLLTASEVCKILRITTQTLWRWEKVGDISSIQVGGQKRYNRADINKLLTTKRGSHNEEN